MSAPLRLRTDSWWDAGRWRAILLGAVPDPRQDNEHEWHKPFLTWLDDGHEEAKVGDVWAFRQRPYGPDLVHSYGRNHGDWWLSHCGLVCPVPTCTYGVHVWDHAYDCEARSTFGAACKVGAGRRSCWTWSGSVERGTLTASPSLMVMPCPDEAGVATTCQFHGFLNDGVLA